MQNSTISDLIAFFQIIIPIAGGVRIAHCFIGMAMDENNTSYKQRIKNIFIFIILSECVLSLVNLIQTYYYGG